MKDLWLRKIANRLDAKVYRTHRVQKTVFYGIILLLVLLLLEPIEIIREKLKGK